MGRVQSREGRSVGLASDLLHATARTFYSRRTDAHSIRFSTFPTTESGPQSIKAGAPMRSDCYALTQLSIDTLLTAAFFRRGEHVPSLITA